MKHFVYPLAAGDGAALTAFLHDPSPEMPERALRPAVLIFPGGAYYGQSDRENEPVAAAFFAQGYHAFALRYTVGEGHRFEEALADAERAIALIRAQGEEWGVDPEQIAVCGFSAGGHLAAASGTMGRHRPNAMILCYPCILETSSPILAFPVPSCDAAVDGRTPPAFLFHTRDDGVVPVANTLRFADALDRAGVSFEMHVFRTGDHGLSLADERTAGGRTAMLQPQAAHWFPLCIDWLKQVFPADRGEV